jgi:hypothetical protein
MAVYKQGQDPGLSINFDPIWRKPLTKLPIVSKIGEIFDMDNSPDMYSNFMAMPEAGAEPTALDGKRGNRD